MSTVQAPPAAAATSSPLPIWLPVGAVWVLYLPVGLQYLFYLGAGSMALALLWRAGRLSELPRQPLFLLALLFWGWMLLSASWSSGAPRVIGAHLWHYSLPLWLWPLALLVDPRHARFALRHFIAASVLVALLLPTLLADQVTGNQRIQFSLLLAMAAVFALIEAVAPSQPVRRRALWLVVAGACLAGLALQDRRTGMLALPLLLGMWVWTQQRNWARRCTLLALVVLAVLLVWQVSPSVRARFVEGLTELRHYPAQGSVETSMGMRLRMLDVSGEMVRERPWFGHGAGAWLAQWQQRVRGGELLQAHTTPHNEYLLITVQGGGVALALFLIALGSHGIAAWRSAANGNPHALLVWTAFMFAAFFNVALRDAKLALPLLMLGALAWAASRKPS